MRAMNRFDNGNVTAYQSIVAATLGVPDGRNSRCGETGGRVGEHGLERHQRAQRQDARRDPPAGDRRHRAAEVYTERRRPAAQVRAQYLDRAHHPLGRQPLLGRGRASGRARRPQARLPAPDLQRGARSRGRAALWRDPAGLAGDGRDPRLVAAQLRPSARPDRARPQGRRLRPARPRRPQRRRLQRQRRPGARRHPGRAAS